MDDDASESLQRLNVILKVNIYTSSYSNGFNKSNWFARVCWTTLPERQHPSILLSVPRCPFRPPVQHNMRDTRPRLFSSPGVGQIALQTLCPSR